MTDAFVGIDPGLKGAIAMISADRTTIEFITMPTVGKQLDTGLILKFLQSYHIQHFFLEHSQAIHKSSAASTFSFGKNFGILIGIISALQLPYTLVKPKSWQKTMWQGTDPSDKPKSRSACAAYRLFPDLSFKASLRSTRDHDGIIDAVLLAEYGRRLVCGRSILQ